MNDAGLSFPLPGFGIKIMLIDLGVWGVCVCV